VSAWQRHHHEIGVEARFDADLDSAIAEDHRRFDRNAVEAAVRSTGTTIRFAINFSIVEFRDQPFGWSHITLCCPEGSECANR